MKAITTHSPYLKSMQFQSKNGKTLVVSLCDDRNFACIKEDGIAIHKDSVPGRIVSAARPKGCRNIAVFPVAAAIDFVERHFAHFDTEVSEADLKAYKKEMMADEIFKKVDREDIKKVFDLLLLKRYAAGHKRWWKLDTFVREKFPERLTSWLQAKIE